MVAVAASVAGIPLQANGIFDFPDFSSTTGLTFVGSAGQAGNQLQITPDGGGQSGAAYSTAAVALGSGDTFSTTFQFQYTGQGGIDPADGITFVMAASPTGLGASGGGMGYGGVGNSVAIEFDSYENGGNDYNSNHVSIDEDGNIGEDASLVSPYGVGACDFYSGYQKTGCFSNGDVWSVTASYDGTNLSLSIWDQIGTYAQASPFTVYTSLPLNVAADLGTNTAYVGFTGGTGSGYEQQNILNWSFANDTSLGTPEPSTWLLFGTAGIGLMTFRIRRGKGAC